MLLDFFFPRNCFGCKASGGYLCKECFSKQAINFIQKCHICGNETRIGLVHSECAEYSYLDGLIYVTLYKGVVKDILLEVKYKYCSAILDNIAGIMSQYFAYYKFPSNFVFTSVPLHNRKLKQRGFNQSDLLAKKISENLGIRYIDLLKRVVYTKTQVGLKKTEREMNLKSAFKIDGKNDVPENLVIVDDVFTTGTTLNECAKILKESGAKKVYGYVFAKSRE